jgi:hypothetical protein
MRRSRIRMGSRIQLICMMFGLLCVCVAWLITSVANGPKREFVVESVKADSFCDGRTPGTVNSIARIKKRSSKSETCPLTIDYVYLHRNLIGIPEIEVMFQNLTDSAVAALEIDVACWNRFDEKVLDWSRTSNIFHGLGQTTISAHETAPATWQLVGHENTAKVVVRVTRAKLANGREWKSCEDESMPSATAFLPD